MFVAPTSKSHVNTAKQTSQSKKEKNFGFLNFYFLSFQQIFHTCFISKHCNDKEELNKCDFFGLKCEIILGLEMEDEENLIESSRLLRLTSDDSDDSSKRIPGKVFSQF